MRFATGTRRWRRRQSYSGHETWLRSCLLILVVSASLWIGRTMQTVAVNARIRGPNAASVPGAQPPHPGGPDWPAAPVDHAPPIGLIQEIWGEHWELGVAIAVCESALQADAVHTGNADGSTDVGLFQINSIHGRSREELRDPRANAQFAYTLFQMHGTAPWESSRPCWAS